MSDGAERIPVTVTYLEMRQRPPCRPVPQPPGARLALMRAERPTLAFYRYLYEGVGARWHWVDRRRLDDDALLAIILDEAVEIYVLYVGGVPAGFAELDFRKAPAVADLAYFGLMPEFIGRGLGPYLLYWAVNEMWRRDPKRVTVNTCTLDHPSALAMYQKAGFRAYDRRQVLFDPRV